MGAIVISPGAVYEIYSKKIDSDYFNEICEGYKTFEIRVEDDCKYNKRDIVILREYESSTKTYTGLKQQIRIIKVWRNIPGLKKGYCIFTFKKLGGVYNDEN